MTVLRMAALALAISTISVAQDNALRRAPASGYRDWHVYGGGLDVIRYSALDQINRDNVGRLEVAWTYDTGDAFEGSEMQCNPLVVNGVLYATTPKLRVIALDAATGALRWSFNPFEGKKVARKIRNRGLNYWRDGEDERIFFAAYHNLYALDARTGRPAPGFGNDGRVDLREGLGRDPSTITISLSTPGVIYKNLLIVGSIVAEDLPASPGDIRAYDVRTGELKWTFHTIPHPGELGYDTWPKDAWRHIGGANNWSGMSLDAGRGIVFAPTGSAAFDFYGANRHGDNLFANSLLALDAATGKRLWHFQFVRHDVWDRDLPAAPSLVTIVREGRLVDAVAQTTKTGHVFVFDREDGTPLFPIEERSIPASDVDGEALAATAPVPVAPPPLVRQAFDDRSVTDRSPAARQAVLAKVKGMRYGQLFTPPSREGTVVFPGLDGGAEWGGAAFDPATGLLYVNVNEMTWSVKLVERARPSATADGEALYAQHCASCHRSDRRGSPPEFPALTDTVDRYSDDELAAVIREGSGRMPGFATSMDQAAVRALARWLLRGEKVVVSQSTELPPTWTKYRLDGYVRLTDPDGYPAVKPPWGTLNAVDLDRGEIKWSVPLGEIPALAAKGLTGTGSENYGGPVVTAGGLVFIGATNHDRKFRAFDKLEGKLLWEATLPAAGNATPAVYDVNGRQFVVIGAGGGKWGQPSGGVYVAFALPST
jgi:glucose dehydrogenase